MAQLPADRTKLAQAQGNMTPTFTASSQKLKDALTEAYDTVDLLNQKVNDHGAAATLPHADKSVIRAKLADKVIGAGQLDDAAVGQSHHQDNGIPGRALPDNVILQRHISDSSVGSAEIIAGAVQRTHLGSGVVGSGQLDPVLLQNYGDIAVQAEFDKRGVNVQKYGAKGDGVADDTNNLQTALSKGGKIFIPEGTYMVQGYSPVDDMYGGLNPVSNSEIIFHPNATLKAITTDKDHYAILNIENVENVKVWFPKIIGDRDTHITSTSQGKSTTDGQDGFNGEWGMGLRIHNSINTDVYSPDCSKCWGDGIVVSGDSQNVKVFGGRSDGNRRQGLSITGAKDVWFYGTVFSNTQGTSPQAGVDIESNVTTDRLQNINLIGCVSRNNRSPGFYVNGNGNLINPVSINFIDCSAENNFNDFAVENNSGTSGTVSIKNGRSILSQLNGLSISQSDLNVSIDGLYIFNPAQSQNALKKYASGVAVVNDIGGTSVGSVYARGVLVESLDGKALATITMQATGGQTANNITNIDIEYKSNLPQDKQISKSGVFSKFTGTQRIVILNAADNPVKRTTNIGTTTTPLYVNQKITNEGATAAITVFVDSQDAYQNGNVLEFEVVEAFDLSLKTNLVVPLIPASVAINTYKSNLPGSRLKIRAENGKWKIIEQIGTWTAV